MKLYACDVIEIRDFYGGDTTLDRLVELVQKNRIYKCPKCNGRGKVSIKYNSYPDNMPDSGWVVKWAYKDIPCDLCDGEGYTEKKYKPRMVQDGWEPIG